MYKLNSYGMDEAKADEEIKKESGYSPQRSYYCMFCDGWHITSKEKQLTLTTKEKLVKRYIQEHQRQNIENRDISIKIDILKCEITDFSKKEKSFEENKEKIKRNEEIKIKDEERRKRNVEDRRKKTQILEDKIKDMDFSQREIYFLEKIQTNRFGIYGRMSAIILLIIFLFIPFVE